MKPIRVVVWGLGTMGSLMAKILSEKEGIDITGAVDLNPKQQEISGSDNRLLPPRRNYGEQRMPGRRWHRTRTSSSWPRPRLSVKPRNLSGR
jgi:predicted dehydrogenase